MKYRVTVHVGARAFGSKVYRHGTYRWYWVARAVATVMAVWRDFREPTLFWTGDEYQTRDIDIWWQITPQEWEHN